jgi:hypothetical protein
MRGVFIFASGAVVGGGIGMAVSGALGYDSFAPIALFMTYIVHTATASPIGIGLAAGLLLPYIPVVITSYPLMALLFAVLLVPTISQTQRFLLT